MWDYMCQGFGGGMGLMTLVWVGTYVWFVIFTVLALKKLGRIVELLEKK